MHLKTCLSLFVCLITLLACQKEEFDEMDNFRYRITNTPLPENPSELKILGIGNSFLLDATEYLPQLLQAEGIRNVTVGRIFNGGFSLKAHVDNFANNSPSYYYMKSDSTHVDWEMIDENATLKQALNDEKWDVIVLQQVSSSSGDYASFQPELSRLLQEIEENDAEKNLTYVWHMTWSYAHSCREKPFSKFYYDPSRMFQAIVETTQKMMTETGIDLIIPTGTALQNLRSSALNNPPMDLTRDGKHSDLGAGRYVEAATWFETLIKPCFGKSVKDNPFRTAKGNVPVTDKNAELIQQAAIQAVENRYAVSSL